MWSKFWFWLMFGSRFDLQAFLIVCVCFWQILCDSADGTWTLSSYRFWTRVLHGTITSRNWVQTPLVTAETDVPEEQPQPHPLCDSQKFPEQMEVSDIKIEVNDVEEPPHPHPLCDTQSQKSPDLMEASEVKIEVDVAEEPPVSRITGNLVHSESWVVVFIHLQRFFCFCLLVCGLIDPFQEIWSPYLQRQ